MTERLLTALSVTASAILACFAIRRILLLTAAFVPPRSVAPIAAGVPSLTLVIPACNEAAVIDGTLSAVASVHYPRERLFVVLVNDCSDDLTGAHLAEWSAGRAHTIALDRPQRGGRPRAVNDGIAAAPASELVAVCDADVRMRPDYLILLAGAFSDSSVGAATGFLAPENADASPIARYAAVESWVNQLVTSAGKDRLDLNPPTLGAAVFRRAALEQVGWFGPGPSGDDVRATVGLTRDGWRTRFVAGAVAETAVVSGWADYWRQHVRWTRDLFSAGTRHRRPAAAAGAARRLELLMLSAGYVDRIALLAAIGLAAVDRVALWMPVAYLGLAGAEATGAIMKAGAAPRLHRFLLSTTILFAVDLGATLAAAAAHLMRRPRAAAAPSRPRPRSRAHRST